MSRLVKVILFLAYLSCTGCSRLQIAYDWADTLILSYVDRYFDLTSAQKDLIRPKIRADLRLLLEKDVPAACLYLEDFIKLSEKKTVSRDEVIAYEARGEALLLTSFRRLEPHVQDFFKILKPEQLEYYKKKIQKQMDEYQERFKSQDRQRDEMEKRIESQFVLVGLDLNRSQAKMLDAFLDQGNFPLVLEKKSRRSNVELFLSAAKSPEKLAALISEIFQNPMKLRSDEYKKVQEPYQARLIDLKVKILASLEPEQQKEIKETIQKLVRQLEALRVREGFSAR